MPKTKKQKKEKVLGFQQAERVGEVNYPVGDFLVRIKNACLAGYKTVTLKSSMKIKAIAQALEREGFLDDVSEVDGNLNIRIAFRSKEPLLMDIKLISKPSLRVYKGVAEIESLKGPSLLLISTPLGILSSKEAIKKRVGGEIIAEVL